MNSIDLTISATRSASQLAREALLIDALLRHPPLNQVLPRPTEVFLCRDLSFQNPDRVGVQVGIIMIESSIDGQEINWPVGIYPSRDYTRTGNVVMKLAFEGELEHGELLCQHTCMVNPNLHEDVILPDDILVQFSEPFQTISTTYGGLPRVKQVCRNLLMMKDTHGQYHLPRQMNRTHVTLVCDHQECKYYQG
jgi:hypothetical protein